MKFSKQKNKAKKITLISIFLAVALVLGVVITLELTRATDFLKNPFYQLSADELEQQRIDKANKSDETGRDKEDIETNPNVDEAKNTSEIPIDSSGSLSVNSLSQSNGKITYTILISGSLADHGTCTVTFSNANARPVTRTSTANSYTCGPQSIPETEFNITGTWQVTVRYFTNDTQVVASSTMEIK